MTKAITDYLNKRKDLWLKKSENNDEIYALEQQATAKFSLEQWILDASQKVKHLSMVTHPSKFSHPSAKTSSIIANAKYYADGYLRSGNISYELDVSGNAQFMDVYKFLLLELSNDKTVLENLEHEDTLIKDFLSSIPALNFTDLRNKFLEIKTADVENKTSDLVKQVYFPLDTYGEEYHLLSVLTPSGILVEVKKRIDYLRFSEEAKQARDDKKKNEYNSVGYSDIYDLTVTGYGGTQPQNISYLNSQNAGRAYLLISVPPSLAKRSVKLPTSDFFAQCLYLKRFKDSFIQLHKLMMTNFNNINIRSAINTIIQSVIDQIIFIAFRIRQYKIGWSNAEHYSRLPKSQRIWLDDVHSELRTSQEDWLEEVSQDIARWLLSSYEKSLINAYELSDIELKEVRKLVIESIAQDKEFL